MQRKRKPGASGKDRVVNGVRMVKLKKTVFDRFYENALADRMAMPNPPKGVVLPSLGAPLKDRVEAFVYWQRAISPKGELGECTECGGDSSMLLTECPYCGEMTEIEGAPAEAAPVVVDTKGEETSSAVVSVVALDEACKLVNDLKGRTASNLYELGLTIKRIFDEQLWKLRAGKQGERVHRTFKQFCEAELGMSYMHCHRLMQVAQSFSPDEMQQFGVSKCHVMLKLPPDRREGLLEQAKGGASRAQLSDAVRQIKDGEKPVAPKGSLTVAMAPGRVEVPLFARVKGRDGRESAKAKPRTAKSIADNPTGEELLGNDVRVHYAVVQNKNGSLVLVVTRKRATDLDVFADEE